MKASTIVIVNPAAGGGLARKSAPAVEDYLKSQGLRVELSESKNPEDLRDRAARAAASGFQHVVALGGDGTFQKVVEGILGTKAVAGFFPAGNGNDMARALGIPRDPVRAADAFLHSRPRAIDMVRARLSGGRHAHYICAGGMGLDAEAAYLANTRFKDLPGASRYLAGALRSFFDGAAFDLSAEIDGTKWFGRAMLAVVANAPWYGSGFCIAPRAEVDDGWLDVVLVREVTWTRLFEAVPILLTSGDLQFEEVERFRCWRLKLETDRPVKVHGDGELLGESPAEFEILPRAVRVMIP
ncbi:MAG TPA: diacylglycerol kinase family protein [Candidatus Acidoferrum sp.]|nr:diacylglycerol kinase family protein [Candidatus Acidoferrum sp.]